MEEYAVKNKLKYGLVLALFFVFTVFFYGPTGIYLANADELRFGLGVVIKVSLIVSLVTFVLITVFSLIVPKKLFKWYMLLVFGVTLGFYVQGNYINHDYGVLDGSNIDWGDYTGYGIVNTLIWAACIILPFIIYLIIRKKDKELINKIVFFACIFLVVIQIPAFISQAASYKKKGKETLAITTKDMFSYAPQDNIVLFILDGMDERYYGDYLSRHPEFEADNEGFVHYDNALTGGARTMMAMPILYTGIPYNRQDTYSDYIDEVFKQDNLLEKMSKAGYEVRIYSETLFFSNDTAEDVENFELIKDPVTSKYMLARKLYKLSLFKFMPHFLKSRFWMNTAEFEEAMKRENDYEFNDIKFYELFNQQKLTIDKSKKKTFTVYHMEGAHRPFDMNEYGKASKAEKPGRRPQMAGVFRIVNDILSDMKEKGIYDSSTIMITADHGDMKRCQRIMLLLKEAGATGEIRYSHAPVSSFDFPIYFAGLAGESMTNEYGVDMLSLKDDDQRTRYLFRNSSDNSKLVVRKYVTNSDAADNDAMIQIDEYVDNAEKEPYVLGDRLGFDADDNGNAYAVEGFSLNHGFRTKIKGPLSTLLIPFAEKTDKTITCKIELHDRTPVKAERTCIIEANGVEVFRGIVNADLVAKGINFEIDPSVFKDNNLQLDFKFPDVPEEQMNLEMGDRSHTMSLVSIVME